LSVAAVLTKGPVGFFPLAAPVLLWIWPLPGRRGEVVARPRSRALAMLAAMVVVMAICGAALVAYEPSHHWATEYVRTQLIPSLQGKREVSGDPFVSVRHLGLGVVSRMLVVAGLFWLGGRRAASRQFARPAVWLIALALCASVPIAISPKLVGHYFVPSVGLFAVGIGAIITGPASLLLGEGAGWHRRVPVILAGGLLIATITVPIVYGPIEPRDRMLLSNLDALAPAMPRAVVLGACRALPHDMDLDTYLNRLFRVSLDASDQPVNGWLLQPDQACPVPQECALAARGERLALFACPK
jgi:hypothetical protein